MAPRELEVPTDRVVLIPASAREFLMGLFRWSLREECREPSI
jgi:hypothetical protein